MNHHLLLTIDPTEPTECLRTRLSSPVQGKTRLIDFLLDQITEPGRYLVAVRVEFDVLEINPIEPPPEPPQLLLPATEPTTEKVSSGNGVGV